jgi:CRP-like cAMP-binding protein
LNYLGARDVFGEMALLDPEPRSATVTAVEDTALLRLDQASFQELLEERSEVARSIIKVLTRRLRERIRDYSEAAGASAHT